MATTSPAGGTGGMRSGLFARRSLESLVAQPDEEGGEKLKRAVGPVQLTALGIGGTIGTGIFVVIGEGAELAGPAVVLSFVLAAVACMFSALSYAELSSSIPISGSAYTYTYASLGELVAWIIGWDLVLEYGVSVAGIAVGWGGNWNEFLDSTFGWEMPTAIATSPENGGVVNLPAVVIVLAITAVLVLGVRESARANLVMVAIKLVVLVFFIIVAFANFSSGNLTPFAPEGRDGVVSAAAVIFFAFIGFDAISTGSEEARNPKRDLPIALLASLAICTVFYVLVALGAVGLASSDQLAGSEAPLAAALDDGAGISWAASVLSFGALIAITSVCLVILFGQTRILYSMCRDGLLPRGMARVSPRFGTPARLTVVLGVLIAILAALVPLSEIVKLVNVGTLFAFVLVNAGVIILKYRQPDFPRAYRVPWNPVLPLIGIGFSVYLMSTLEWETWIRFLGWMALGLIIYFAYGYRHSRLRSHPEEVA
ncbi:amino acid permease [Kineosporia sp. NBRC 101677]|uniref:amino acid permease n=1 Tax=Kineosporia sp. NBRC 101677 TaxID=3032197 RepID=UPI0024A13581|nr:amino acid permease [Kineosporia sp. NBRC 101677]GLY14590.1 amino acid permease [Kineosporia sp. NBRC 101677]